MRADRIPQKFLAILHRLALHNSFVNCLYYSKSVCKFSPPCVPLPLPSHLDILTHLPSVECFTAHIFLCNVRAHSPLDCVQDMLQPCVCVLSSFPRTNKVDDRTTWDRYVLLGAAGQLVGADTFRVHKSTERPNKGCYL